MRQPEGEVRGFLVLRGEDGAFVANGDSMQTVRNGKLVYRAVYRFKDGSLQDETTIFTQSGHFRVLSDHLIQKGPLFKHPIDMTVNAGTGEVTVLHTDDKGVQKTENAHMKLPTDLANGIVPILLKNLAPGTASITESMVVASPKPMLIKLQIRSEGEDSFTTGSLGRKATRYTVHVDIGGVKGAVANAIGKEPPDTQVWILGGECPTFLRAEGPTFDGGPIWSTELVSPIFPKGSDAATREKK
ncbi:MAG TPA: hypothetical protein VMB03_12575 [Bryobacteraceae bacterium]|nr:hypothetical protein [Bryobacteraceae bacterium]